jgi:hypothetical protein
VARRLRWLKVRHEQPKVVARAQGAAQAA